MSELSTWDMSGGVQRRSRSARGIPSVDVALGLLAGSGTNGLLLPSRHPRYAEHRANQWRLQPTVQARHRLLCRRTVPLNHAMAPPRGSMRRSWQMGIIMSILSIAFEGLTSGLDVSRMVPRVDGSWAHGGVCEGYILVFVTVRGRMLGLFEVGLEVDDLIYEVHNTIPEDGTQARSDADGRLGPRAAGDRGFLPVPGQPLRHSPSDPLG